MNPPDSRGWAAIGLFVTFAAMVALRAFVPSLAKDETFNNVFVAFATGGPLLIASYFFGSSKPVEPPK